MRYVMRIAKLCESLKILTHIARQGYALMHSYLSVQKLNSPSICMYIERAYDVDIVYTYPAFKCMMI